MPSAMSVRARPIGKPNLCTAAPATTGRSASLWPFGIASATRMPAASSPAAKSRSATATSSRGSTWNTGVIIAVRLHDFGPSRALFSTARFRPRLRHRRGGSMKAFRTLAVALILAAPTPVAAQQNLQQRVEARLGEAGLGVRFGLLVADEAGHELVAISPDGRFMPASNTKLF